MRAISAIVGMCCFFVRALPPSLGCFVRYRVVVAPIVALVVFRGCLGPSPGAMTCSFPKSRKTCSLLKPGKHVLCPSLVVRLSPRSVRPSVLPVHGFPRLLKSVPLLVAEFLRLLELVSSPIAPDSALVYVVPMSRPVLPQPPPPWFPGGSSIQSSLVPVLASAL